MKVSKLKKILEEFDPESEINFCQMNGDIGYWNTDCLIQNEGGREKEEAMEALELEHPDVEFMIIQRDI